MLDIKDIESRLAAVGLRNKFWSRSEMHELRHIIMSDETIIGAVSGRYAGGFALLVATDRRILLIDKKLISLSLEDVRYDMIAEVDFFAHVFEATITIVTLSKSLKFTSLRNGSLRQLTSFVQEQVMQLRHANNFAPLALPNTQDPAQSYLVPNSSQPQRPMIQSFHKTAPTGAYPGTSLTVRRRISRFYPTTNS